MKTSKGNKPYVSGSVLNRSSQPSFSVAPSHYIGYFGTAYPVLINRVQNKSRGIQQIKSIEASGSNDLTVSTIDLILLSAEVEMRGSKFRGFPQLSSQTI